jgi:hypothetical protein
MSINDEKVEFERRAKCPTCEGFGFIDHGSGNSHTCTRCEGNGMVSSTDVAEQLLELAESRESAPNDYYGAQFWDPEDIALLRAAARLLQTNSKRGSPPFPEGGGNSPDVRDAPETPASKAPPKFTGLRRGQLDFIAGVTTNAALSGMHKDQFLHAVSLAWDARAPRLPAEKGACCDNERRNMNGGCDNCGDPCI